MERSWCISALNGVVPRPLCATDKKLRRLAAEIIRPLLTSLLDTVKQMKEAELRFNKLQTKPVRGGPESPTRQHCHCASAKHCGETLQNWFRKWAVFFLQKILFWPKIEASRQWITIQFSLREHHKSRTVKLWTVCLEMLQTEFSPTRLTLIMGSELSLFWLRFFKVSKIELLYNYHVDRNITTFHAIINESLQRACNDIVIK